MERETTKRWGGQIGATITTAYRLLKQKSHVSSRNKEGTDIEDITKTASTGTGDCSDNTA